jgi:hypothetical protein
MLGNMPVKADDKGFVINGFQFYVGVWGDDSYTRAKLVVETQKGGGQYGDPKVVGSTWKELAKKEVEYEAGERMTEQQRQDFLEAFRVISNVAITSWVAQNGGGAVPEVPKDLWGWLRWQFQNRMEFNTQTNQLYLK